MEFSLCFFPFGDPESYLSLAIIAFGAFDSNLSLLSPNTSVAQETWRREVETPEVKKVRVFKVAAQGEAEGDG